MRNSLFILLVFGCGCGAAVSPYARVAAGRIGCPAEAIDLGRVQRAGGGPESWVARCGRRAYACSSNVSPASPNARVVCSEIK